MVELLLQHGAHWWTPDSNHKTPLDLAKMSRAIDCIHIIEAHAKRDREFIDIFCTMLPIKLLTS